MDENYEKVLEQLPYWEPSREVRNFGISAIQSIVKCGLLEAVEIRDRLSYEGALPERKY